MRRRAAGTLLAAAVACTAQPHPVSQDVPQGAPRSWADSILAGMTVREKAAQMVWPFVLGDHTARGSQRWAAIARLIEHERVGGFIVSVGTPADIAVKLNAMQRLSRTPLLVAADYEAGAGFRARGGVFLPNAIELGGAVVLPPAMAFGATRSEDLAYQAGRITALEGRAMGVHITFAPVLDVNNNPANPVINTRSYGENPGLVARMGVAFMRGVQDHGMVATGKHFPGHGDTEVNSHLALPEVDVTRARLDSVELVPFRAAVNAGVGAIMTFHGSLPALQQGGIPATLSRAVVTGLLRDELRFDGLIVTDAMDMRGVLDRFGAEEAAKRAVEAGADVLLQPMDVTQTIDAIVAGVTEGRYDEARLDRTVRRILQLKERFGLHLSATVDLEAIPRTVGDSGHLRLAREVAERSVTVVRNAAGALPLSRGDRNLRVLSVTLARRTDLQAGVAFDAELRRAHPRTRSEVVVVEDRTPGYERILAASDSFDVVVVASYVSHGWDAVSADAPDSFASFLRALRDRGREPVVVAMGNPYLLRQIPWSRSYLVGWGVFPVSQRAAARVILGETPATGRLPISILPGASYGAGLALRHSGG